MLDCPLNYFTAKSSPFPNTLTYPLIISSQKNFSNFFFIKFLILQQWSMTHQPQRCSISAGSNQEAYVSYCNERIVDVHVFFNRTVVLIPAYLSCTGSKDLRRFIAVDSSSQFDRKVRIIFYVIKMGAEQMIIYVTSLI